MNSISHLKSLKKSISGPKVKAIGISPSNLVRMEWLQPEKKVLKLVRPAVEGISLTEWAGSNRETIEAQLLKNGALLFRNFKLDGVCGFERLIEDVSGEMIDYTYRSTPRTHVSGKIYTSTEYPARQHIPLHNEMAYSSSWPMRIWFYCVKSAEQGGETPVADSRSIFARIDAQSRERFARKGVMYIRNYGNDLDLSWEDVFQTTDRREVEAFCRRAGIEFEWRDGNRLRTRQVCQAVLMHPRTGEVCWFNQAHLFHISSLEPEVRESLLATFKEEDLPRNAYYGDGSTIDDSVMSEIRHIYQQAALGFSWQEGDVLMLDNVLVAHGRTPFVGARKIVVGMADLFQSRGF